MQPVEAMDWGDNKQFFNGRKGFWLEEENEAGSRWEGEIEEEQQQQRQLLQQEQQQPQKKTF